MKTITFKQKEILSYIQNYYERRGCLPSYREIAKQFSLSSLGSVYKHIQALKRKGFLETENGKSLLQDSLLRVSSKHSFPLIGQISAGLPIHLSETPEQILLPRNLIEKTEKIYVLRVFGATLHDELMQDGDLLIVEARDEAVPGELTIGIINQYEAFIKKYYPEGEYIRLQSCSLQQEQMVLHRDDVKVQGIVLNLLRNYSKI